MKLTHKEFAAHIGKEPKNLYTYLGRKEIVKEGDYYDTDNEVNRLFIEKIAAKYGLPGAKTAVNADIPEEKEEEKTVKKGKKASDMPYQGHESEYKRSLLDAKKAEIEKIALTSEKLKIDLARMTGKMIPVAPVYSLVKMLAQFILIQMKQEMDKEVADIAHKYELSGEDVSLIKKSITKSLNKAVEKAIENAVSNIDTIINEHSEQGRPGKSKN